VKNVRESVDHELLIGSTMWCSSHEFQENEAEQMDVSWVVMAAVEQICYNLVLCEISNHI